MAETYEDYGDYSEELLYQQKSRLGKIFSLRTLKKVLKAMWIFLVMFVFGILFYRLFSSGAPKSLSGVLWTKELYAQYEERGMLTAYEQKPVQSVADDGYFGVFEVVYFPEADELQMTVRYNNSTVKKLEQKIISQKTEALRAEITEALSLAHPDWFPSDLKSAVEQELSERLAAEPITADVGERPFVFLLRDETGKVYTSYQYLATSKNVYQFVRLSFSGVNLLGTTHSVPQKEAPVPDVPLASYLYKGANAAASDAVRYLYLDMYYENEVDLYGESFAYPLQVYRSSYDLEPYSFHAPTGISEGLEHIALKNTVEP